MRLQEIVGILREYFFLALVAVIVLGILFLIGYFLVYRKLLGGKRRLSKGQLLVVGMFTGYMLMVLGVTFLNRGPNFHGGMNVSFFSTYREAWHSFSVRHWQFVVLNIFMFVPFGILLPLVHARFRTATWAIGAAALFTLSIETLQLLTRFGNFVVDDLFNNLLGGMIGYGIIMGIMSLKARGIKRAALYFSPLMLVVILFASMFSYYHLKEFGNLPIVPSQRVNMAQVEITVDVELDDKPATAPIYLAPTYTQATADEFVTAFFEKIKVDTSNLEIISYQNESIYWSRGAVSHNLWFDFLDGSYRYSDFSSFEGGMAQDADEETLLGKLDEFGIEVPADAIFQKIETGVYEWAVDQMVVGDQLIDGVLMVNYYNDDTVKTVENQLVTYDKVRDVEMKSEKEAYEDILAGKFSFYSETGDITSIHVHGVELDYHLDTKGYYQPVYAFRSIVDGREATILVPGM